MSKLTPIGFIGTGLMGAPMVRRLLDAGYAVHIWNRSDDKSDALQKAGASVRSSPADVARHADIVCLCVTDATAVEAVVFGELGVVHGARRNTILVDFSSIKPDATRSMAERLFDVSDMHWVDAPVSGGVRGATDGTLIIMCGGEDAVIERLAPVFDVVSERTTHMGSTGAGQVTKLCNQVIVSSNLLAISEALLLGQLNGIRVDRLPTALQGGWADSLPLQIIGPLIAGAESENRIGALANMLKDVDVALDVAGDRGAAMRVTREVVATYKDACQVVGGDADITALRAFYEISGENGDQDD